MNDTDRSGGFVYLHHSELSLVRDCRAGLWRM
jgi:hypothetical protein